MVGLFLIANLVDATITCVGLRHGNVREKNPIYDLLIAQLGLLPAMGVKMLLVFVVVAFIILLARKWSKAWTVLKIVNMVVCLAVIWNLVITILL